MAGGGARRGAKWDAEQAAFREKSIKALTLREEGWSLSKIAAELGYAGRQGAAYAIDQAIEAIKPDPAMVEKHRQIAEARLDWMLDAIKDRVRLGELEAIDRALRIESRRAKLLGLDAPIKQELTGPNGGPVVLSTAHDELLGRLARLADSVRSGGGHPPADAGRGDRAPLHVESVGETEPDPS